MRSPWLTSARGAIGLAHLEKVGQGYGPDLTAGSKVVDQVLIIQGWIAINNKGWKV